MFNLQACKIVNAIPPKGGTFTAVEIDTQGFGEALILVSLGNIDPSGVTTLKLQETDTTGAGYADITGARFGTDADISGATSALPAASDDNKVFAFDVNLHGRKRFLKVVASGGGTTGTIVSAVAILGRAGNMPASAAERGLANVLRLV